MYRFLAGLPLVKWLYGFVRMITDLFSVFSIPFYELFQGHEDDYNQTMSYHDGFPLPRLLNSKVMEKLAQFPLRSSDVFIAGFPKSGTTWLQILLSMLYDDWGTCKQNSHERVPILEMPKIPGIEGYRQCLEAQSPRLIKSHLPYNFFPKCRDEVGCKVIYISRNPKDVCVSFFHMLKGYQVLQNDNAWPDFVEKFVAGKVIYGKWYDHITSWWNKRDEHILFLTYEEMKKDTSKTMKKVIEFLDRPVSTQRFEHVMQWSGFQKMKTLGREKVAVPRWFYDHKNAPFFRKGVVGDWKNHFSKEENELIDREIGEKVRGTELEFLYNW